jgi:hypothetical protein
MRMGKFFWFFGSGYWQTRAAPLAPLRAKIGTAVAPATQAIAGSQVNVMDPCATFFGNVAQGGGILPIFVFRDRPTNGRKRRLVALVLSAMIHHPW